jgi:ATP-dependent protease ClpP protease subunit
VLIEDINIMRQTLSIFGILLFSLALTSAQTHNIILKPENVAILRGQVTGESVDKVIMNMLIENPQYLYIDSPGGSVMAGNRLIELLLQRNVTCIADTAYSMAFAILQACSERYITTTATVMQHQPSLGVNGELYPMANYLKMIHSIEEFMIDLQSKRIGIEPEELRRKTDTEWWLFGEDIIKENVADETVSVTCSPELAKLTNVVEKDSFFFGKKTMTYSGCPLIREPIKIEYEE